MEESLTDFDGVYFSFACSVDGEPLEDHEGELVRMQGKRYEKYTTRRDAMGGYHITRQTMPVGLTGTGETSGEEFRAVEQEHATYNQTQAGFNGAWRAELKLTGKDTGRTFWLVFSGNFRLSADGDLVVERDEQTVVCRPGSKSLLTRRARPESRARSLVLRSPRSPTSSRALRGGHLPRVGDRVSR